VEEGQRGGVFTTCSPRILETVGHARLVIQPDWAWNGDGLGSVVVRLPVGIRYHRSQGEWQGRDAQVIELDLAGASC
jgi:hypothetical protein